MLALRHDTDIDGAADELRSLARDARNLLVNPDLLTLRRDYAAWVFTAESHLRALFTDPQTWAELRDATYWSICDKNHGHVRMSELVRVEVEYQASRLEHLTSRLQAFAAWLGASQGHITVLDTHVLLHFQLPVQVKWAEVVGGSPVRLVVPLRVIEELDEKKYTARDDIADRSRRLLSDLRSRLGSSAPSPAKLNDDTTIEVLLDDEPRHRTQDADQEILDACENLRMAGAPVLLVTDDTGLTLRARALHVEVVAMPERYLRKPLQPST